MLTTLDSIRDVRIYQPRDGYRFSVDALLLFSFVRMKSAESIADLGAGSGIVGILLAKKYPGAKVLLVELQRELCELAEKNIRTNGLGKSVEALNLDVRAMTHCAGEYDLVVSNPPFRKTLTGRLSSDRQRAVARHEIELKLDDLLLAAARLLKNRGRLALIYHPQRLAELMDSMRRALLEPKRLRFIHGREGSEAKMMLVEAVKNGREGLKVESPLFVYQKDGSYTEEVRRAYGLTGD